MTSITARSISTETAVSRIPRTRHTLAPDTFRYRVDGGLLGLSNTATVTINVTNDAPIARPDAYSAVADVEKSIAAPGVLGNDDDADGDDMTIDVVQEPAHGNLNERDDGSFRYKADDGFGGTDTWRYRVTDGLAWSNMVTVTMTVSAPATPQADTGPRRPLRRRPHAETHPDTDAASDDRADHHVCHHCRRSVRCHRSSPGRPLRRARHRADAPTDAHAHVRPAATASARPTELPGGPLGPAGPVASPGSGSSDRPAEPPRHPSRREPPFTLPSVDDGGDSNSTPAPSRSTASNGPCRPSS